LNTELIGLSVDSLYAHIAWLRTIKEKIKWKGMENVEVTFPLIEDIKMDVANKFGMIQPAQSTTQAVRAVFIIDPKATIRCILYYPQSTGRNFEEIKMIVIALQKTDAEGVSTPANWKPGDPLSYEELVARAENSESLGYYCPFWYLCYTNINTENTNTSAPSQVDNNAAPS